MTIFSIISYGSLVRLTDLARSDYSNTLNDKRRSVVNELYSYLAAEKWTKGTFDFTSMIAEGVGNGADCVNDWNSNGTVDPIDNTCIAIPYRNGSGSIAFHKADGLIAVDSSITPITASPTILATSPYLPWAYMAEF